jgi:hypothetical protein
MSQKENDEKKDDGDNKARPKRFLNGWTKEQERLMSEWSDIAMCYRWLHDQSGKLFHRKTLWINLPVIILSTLGGTANFGISSVFEDEASKKYASFAIGGISLLAGLMTTIGNYLRYPQLEEAHGGASISWGKLQRLIAVELALHPNDRIDSLDFLKICRAELDRLIEQSPPIPTDPIEEFREKFGHISDLKKPDICGALEHTLVFESSEERLKHLAVDAALLLKHRKNALNELTSPRVQDEIKKHVTIEIENALESQREKIKEEMEKKKEEEEKTKEEFERTMEERKKKIQEEINEEKKKIMAQNGLGGSPSVPRSSSESTLETRMNFNRGMLASTVKPFDLSHPPTVSRRESIPPPHTDEIPKNIVVNPLFDRSRLVQQSLQGHASQPSIVDSPVLKSVVVSPQAIADMEKYGDLSQEEKHNDMTTQT